MIGIMDGEEFNSVIAPSCVDLENESLKKQVEAVKSKVSQCDHLLSFSLKTNVLIVTSSSKI